MNILLKICAPAALLVSAAVARGDVAQTAVETAPAARRVVNLINFVRAADPRKPREQLLEAVREEAALNGEYGFKTTVLLEYDALVEPDFVAEVRKNDPEKTEYGLWFEMSRVLNEAAGLKWVPSAKHKGWDWDWLINPGYLLAYAQADRKKLIDEAFGRFKAEFGHYPKTAGSWLLDAWSMDYMVREYGVEGFAICREQDSTDAYGLRGGYFNGAYYPSKKNMLSAAVDMANAIPAPAFRMLTPDPIYNYGRLDKIAGDYPDFKGCPTMEPVWRSGSTKDVVDWYFRIYTQSPGLLNLSYMMTGQENSFGWRKMAKGIKMQYAKIAEEAAAGRICVETLGETARRFKAEHPVNCPQTQIALEDWSPSDRKSVWYNSRFYRANIVLEKGRLFFRDLHKMSDAFAEPYLDKPCKGLEAFISTPPVVDWWLYRSDDASGTMAFEGEFERVAVEGDGRSVLTVAATRPDGSEAKIRFDEGTIAITGSRLAAEYAPGAFREAIAAAPDGIAFEYEGFRYRVGVEGRVAATQKGFEIAGDEIKLDLALQERFSARPAPRPALLKRLVEGPEIIGIVHMGLTTYTDREWGFGDVDPALFNPAKFDADKVVAACKAGGIGGLVIVAKHHDGFCLWPTATTPYNIGASPFRGGKGDFVREMADACRRAGLKFGVYVSPWDRNNPHYATEKYVEIYHGQIKELLGGAYGEVFEMWFDGANGGDGWYGGANERRRIGKDYYRFGEVFAFVRARQPSAVIFCGERDDSDFRWPGNEKGLLAPDCRATVRPFDDPEYRRERNLGSKDGAFFRPCEADFPLRRGWVWHKSEKGQTRNAAWLTKLYLESVGCGGTMNIGVAPDTDGLVDEEDARALEGFTAMRRALFAHEAKDGEPFNVVVMQEDVSHGELVDGWRIVADGRKILSGESIGVKRIRLLDKPVAAGTVRLEITAVAPGVKGVPVVKLRRYLADEELVKTILGAKRDDKETDTARWMEAAALEREREKKGDEKK